MENQLLSLAFQPQPVTWIPSFTGIIFDGLIGLVLMLRRVEIRIQMTATASKDMIVAWQPLSLVHTTTYLDRHTAKPLKHETGGRVRCGAKGIEVWKCGRCSCRKGSGMMASMAPGVLSARRFSTVVSSSFTSEAEAWRIRP